MDYDSWKTGYYDYNKEINCHYCEEKQHKINEAKHFMEEIVKQLYMKGPLDIEILDHCVSEICHYLDVRLGIESLQIERKKTIPYISDWIQENNNFLNTLVK